MNLVFTLKRGEIAVELLIARSEHQAGSGGIKTMDNGSLPAISAPGREDFRIGQGAFRQKSVPLSILQGDSRKTCGLIEYQQVFILIDYFNCCSWHWQRVSEDRGIY